MTRNDMKRRAKALLGGSIFKNRWMMALLVCLILSAITAAAGTVIPGLGIAIVVGPMTYGIKKMFLKQAREDRDMNLGDMFCGFTDDFGGTFLMGLLSTLFVLLWMLLLIIPGIIKGYAYELIYYIKADHPEYDWRTCLKESERMMKGHKWEMFVLDLSFLGWIIVGALCLGIGDLWVVPYIEATKTQFYLNLRGERTYEYQDSSAGGPSSAASGEKKDWDPER